MYKHNICEALYALPSGRVVARRRTVIKPVSIVLLGIALLLIDHFAVEQRGEALSLSLILAGITLLIYGIARFFVTLTSKESIPYDSTRSSYLRYRERYYDRSLLAALCQAIDSGDTKALELMPTTNVSAILLAQYRSGDGSIEAYAIYEYVEEEYRAVGEPKIIER